MKLLVVRLENTYHIYHPDINPNDIFLNQKKNGRWRLSYDDVSHSYLAIFCIKSFEQLTELKSEIGEYFYIEVKEIE